LGFEKKNEMDLNGLMPFSTSTSTDGAVNIAGLAPKFLSHCYPSEILRLFCMS